MNEVKGFVHSIETFGALDGPGIRYAVFLQGCPLRCLYCHNPDTWPACSPGARVMTAEELVKDILQYRNFIKSGGVTLTGGEPLYQPEFAERVLRLLKERNIHTAVDTSGAVPLAACEEAVDLADLILLDIKAYDPELCRKITGEDNRNAFALLRHREETGKDVWIRHVIVPGLTLDYGELEKLAVFLKEFKCIRKIELLPFHKMGEYKWEEARIDYSLRDTREPTAEEMEHARAIFRGHHLHCD